jgi:bidirectional [NiFe] hydrogenase diaphorase subunit
MEGAHTWDMAGRGSKPQVITDLNQPWGSSQTFTSFGKCVNACPTGAIFYQGSSVGEMKHDRSKIDFLVNPREKKQWNY